MTEEEFLKEAASRARRGRRPMRLSTLLEKEQSGVGWTGRNKSLEVRTQAMDERLEDAIHRFVEKEAAVLPGGGRGFKNLIGRPAASPYRNATQAVTSSPTMIRPARQSVKATAEKTVAPSKTLPPTVENSYRSTGAKPVRTEPRSQPKPSKTRQPKAAPQQTVGQPSPAPAQPAEQTAAGSSRKLKQLALTGAVGGGVAYGGYRVLQDGRQGYSNPMAPYMPQGY